MLRCLVLQDINTVFVQHSYGIRPGRTITEQSYEFPVCANVGVLFSLDILSQVCEKHIESSSLAISVLVYYTTTSCFSA